MSSSNSKEPIIMIDVEYIDKIKWDAELGERLKTLRGNTSRRELAVRTKALGRRVAHQYIQQLEQPTFSVNRLKRDYLTVSLDIVRVLAEALGVELVDIFAKSAKISAATHQHITATSSNMVT
jgi:hypothetical protein